MSMSDCDWIIYGPDGTVTVDIGRWETYRERRDFLKEIELLKERVEELELDVEEYESEIEKLEHKLEVTTAKLKDVSYSEGGE